MVDDIFGDILFRPEYSQQMKQFPSPEQLKEKILISTKPPESPESQDQRVREGHRLEYHDDRTRVNYKVKII